MISLPRYKLYFSPNIENFILTVRFNGLSTMFTKRVGKGNNFYKIKCINYTIFDGHLYHKLMHQITEKIPLWEAAYKIGKQSVK